MALKVPNEGELQLLDKMLLDALSVDENYILKLYRVNRTPGDTDTTSNYTEANFTAYASKTLTRARWNAASTVSGKAESTYGTQQSWTSGTAGNTIFGYYIVAATSNKLLWAEKFGTPRVLAESDVLNLTPKFTLASES